MQLNWKDLEVFVHVCEAGSLTKGAERSHMSIPAVSARIQRLEGAAGSALLVRLPRGVVPTELGKKVLARAKKASDEVAQLRADLEGRKCRQHAVRVLCNTSALLHHVPRFLSELLSAPEFGPIDIAESSSRQSVFQLQEQHAQIAIVSDAVDVRGLEVEPLCEDHLLLVVHEEHSLRGEPVSFATALEYPQICFGTSSALTTHLSEQAQSCGRALRPRVCVNDLGTIGSLVQRGNGVAILSRTMWRAIEGRGNLRAIALSDRWARRKLIACSARPTTSDPDLRRLFDTVVHAFRAPAPNSNTLGSPES